MSFKPHPSPDEFAGEPRVHVFIYTYNKGADLQQTLSHLARTDYGNYKLFLLNNGSTDGTDAAMGSLNGRFKELKKISLPVNIGAPAARNWLVSDPENRGADFLVFFDDDIIVEPSWLRQMLSTFGSFPDAGVIGAKIINAEGLKTIQHSGGVLTQSENWIDHVLLFSNMRDDGRFDNISERDYLMGCANLYRRAVFDDVGGFDLQFSPTQFDDVDHHLRMRLKGYRVVFNGLVEIRHLRRSGGTATPNHLANRFKLASKYTSRDIDQIIGRGALQNFVSRHPWVVTNRQ